jgi:anaerobic ribonucleoside-triphosphate reductase activating protein
MKLRINKAHYPVTVLGHGKRIGLWLQGCSLGCPGCCSQDTWDKEGGAAIDVAALPDWCRDSSDGDLDGVTLSGGEPFEQPEALAALLSGLRAWTQTLGREVDLLCYSGLPLRRLQADYAPILALLDAIIPEPFVQTLPAAALRGSANQPLVALSDLGRRRYSSGNVSGSAGKRLQIQVDENRIWMIGIPKTGDLERLEASCRERGLLLDGVSWRA